MKFLQKLFGLDEQEKMIWKKFDELQVKMLHEMNALKLENTALKDDVAVKDRKITELTQNLRKQNEADLFLEMERLKKRILDGEKRETIDLTNYNSMVAMQNMYNAQLGSQQYQGLLGSIGSSFGGGFGR